jgi:hypothetical protein
MQQVIGTSDVLQVVGEGVFMESVEESLPVDYGIFLISNSLPGHFNRNSIPATTGLFAIPPQQVCPYAKPVVGGFRSLYLPPLSSSLATSLTPPYGLASRRQFEAFVSSPGLLWQGPPFLRRDYVVAASEPVNQTLGAGE